MSTFVLVHGAFGQAAFWQPVVPYLHDLGHAVRAVDLPSAGHDPAALGLLPDDVAHVRQVLDDLGGDAVLVGHSRGGMVITALADHPAVRHSVYVAAFCPQDGQSLAELLTELPRLDWFVPRTDGSAALSDDLQVVTSALWHDLDQDGAARAHALCRLQRLGDFELPVSVPERKHPTTYVVCERDQVMPVEVQQLWARGTDRVVSLDTAHCPMRSAPAELAAVLDGALALGRTSAGAR